MLVGWLSVIPMLIWWLGWFPGYLSPDSIDQLGQVARFDFANIHPISHTASGNLAAQVGRYEGEKIGQIPADFPLQRQSKTPAQRVRFSASWVDCFD